MADTSSSALRLAIAATFTADPIAPVISFWKNETESDLEVRFAPFNQVVQSLLDPSSELSLNRSGVNVVLLRLEDLAPDAALLEANVHHIADELRSAPERLSVPLIVMLCPSSPASIHARHADKLETFLEATLDDVPGAQFIPRRTQERLYPVADVHSPEGERLGRIPYTEAWFCAAGTMLVRHMFALIRQSYKVIALDCDNTLWAGICGEDGPENVVLDPPRRALQQAMLSQQEDGMLLTLASKNNEEDVLDTFAAHPEMPLQMRHFVTWRLNWEPKARNLQSIASQLSLGIDSFIFIDDSPKECAELSDALPSVLTLALPSDLSRLPQFLHHVWAFDHPVVTEEDRNRSRYYAQAAEFGNAVRKARTLGDFAASLQLNVQVQHMTNATLPRVAQLTQRTNQFNTTTIRRTEADLRNLVLSGAVILTADVSDRFGDYGLVGVLVLLPGPSKLTIDSMMLSCRALGRGVEHRLLAEAAKVAVERALHRVAIPFYRTAKNKPALDFVQSLGGEWHGDYLHLQAEDVVDLQWMPQTASPVEDTGPVKIETRHTLDYAHIANQLSTVPDILSNMRRRSVTHIDESLTGTEQKLARIWGELLDKPVIHRHDNFFDLGGHSLVAVLLLMRIREAFAVELAIDDVYTGGLTLPAWHRGLKPRSSVMSTPRSMPLSSLRLRRCQKKRLAHCWHRKTHYSGHARPAHRERVIRSGKGRVDPQ